MHGMDLFDFDIDFEIDIMIFFSVSSDTFFGLLDRLWLVLR